MRDLFYDLVRRNGMAVSIYLMLAVSIWVFLLIILPQLTMLDYSFRFNLPPAKIGGPEDVYTLEQYRYFFQGSGASDGRGTAEDVRSSPPARVAGPSQLPVVLRGARRVDQIGAAAGDLADAARQGVSAPESTPVPQAR